MKESNPFSRALAKKKGKGQTVDVTSEGQKIQNEIPVSLRRKKK
jgi:hypothetical protein